MDKPKDQCARCPHNRWMHMLTENSKPGRCEERGVDDILASWRAGRAMGKSICPCPGFESVAAAKKPKSDVVNGPSRRRQVGGEDEPICDLCEKRGSDCECSPGSFVSGRRG